MVEFRIEGDDCPLADASSATGTSIEAAPPLLRDDRNVLLRFSAQASDKLIDYLDEDDRIRYLYQSVTDGRYNYRCLSLQQCVVHKLISAGFMVESLTYRNGNAILTGAVVGHEILQTVMETAGETVGVKLQRVYALRATEDASIAQQWDLTPAQTESLRYAVEMGYFLVPRQTTASEVAAELGISKSAFLERLHRAQHSLFTQLFGDTDGGHLGDDGQ
ncbi:transcriptional regulator [Haloarcula sp. Atlit-47R]|uniref:helix-turn-helix domain-containing protein n=1 Tax=Haloarcula sp. Atlit-47R TaxID=2282132 RepID=UPI000EF26FE4|nr:helix-turn-helix domain-containing protein [Haloarcula sp. Atlit-47R]RLM44311.1 transcriptional regulator [Haloarcula sp. Atlit-47R]